jgi:hypothetical protein
MANQINALIQLLDDPDEQIFTTVRNEIVKLKTAALPHLYSTMYDSPDAFINDRIKNIIDEIELEPQVNALHIWKMQEMPNLFEGLLIINQIVHAQQFDVVQIQQAFDTIQKTIWVELNNYLTPLEKIRIISQTLFNIQKINAQIVDYAEPNHFLIENTLLQKTGNNFSVSLLFLALCQNFDLPIQAIKFPNHIMLAFANNTVAAKNNFSEISFFIDPSFGNFLTKEAVITYFNRIEEELNAEYFTYKTNQQLLYIYIQELAKCYKAADAEKLNEIAAIILE